MTPSRRLFLRNGIITLAAVGGGAMLEPRFLARAAAAAGSLAAPKAKCSSASSSAGRPTGCRWSPRTATRSTTRSARRSAVPRPEERRRRAALDLDGYFGLHPRLDALLPLLQAGRAGRRPRLRVAEHLPVALRHAGLHGGRASPTTSRSPPGWAEPAARRTGPRRRERRRLRRSAPSP